MCGRYTLTRSEDELVETFDVPGLTFAYEPRYNIAPGQVAPVLAQDRKGRRIGPLLWGLVPAWSPAPAKGHINARAETVAEAPSFRDAFARRRCLVPADGFFEWRKDPGARAPFWFHRPDRALFTMAAIWESWSPPGEDGRHAFAVLTTEASADVRDVHHRMPVVIDAEDRDAWLARDTSVGEALALMASPGAWARHQVDGRVGSPANDDPGLIDPV